MYKILGPAHTEFSSLGNKRAVLLRHSLTITYFKDRLKKCLKYKLL